MRKLLAKLDAALLRSILASYYATVVRSLSNAAPKAVMLHLVRAVQARNETRRETKHGEKRNTAPVRNHKKAWIYCLKSRCMHAPVRNHKEAWIRLCLSSTCMHASHE